MESFGFLESLAWSLELIESEVLGVVGEVFLVVVDHVSLTEGVLLLRPYRQFLTLLEEHRRSVYFL